MGTITLFLLALGLSMDAFAVSISNGMCYRNFHRRQAVASSFAFGLFQMLMPIAGFFAGRTFSDAISSLDHWIALILLGFIGGKMVFDGIQDLRNPEACDPSRSFDGRTLLLQAVATSIDALAVGISFAVMQVNILLAARIHRGGHLLLLPRRRGARQTVWAAAWHPGGDLWRNHPGGDRAQNFH